MNHEWYRVPRALLVPVAVLWHARLDVISGQLVTAPEPPGGSHCACDGGICRIDANGRACSCGCAKKRSEEHTSELQSLAYLVCRLLLEKKKKPHGHRVDRRAFVLCSPAESMLDHAV